MNQRGRWPTHVCRHETQDRRPHPGGRHRFLLAFRLEVVVKRRTVLIILVAVLVSLLLLGATVELTRRLVEAIFGFGPKLQQFYDIVRIA